MEIEQLGPYRIVRKLGRGGMGTVYEALDLDSGQRAAVKLLAASLAHDLGFRERFEGEIETLKRLNHPNIVRLFGFGQQQHHLFYAMELVDGESLEHDLEHGRRFDWREVTRIGIDVCRALRHAHDRGVIHRDIKPGNLLMTREGHTKLSDFGIARMFGSTGLTGVGSVLGTAEYMAPEQAEGRPVSPRSDLYSLGVVFYVLLTGRPLFRGKSLPEVLHKQRFEKPDPVSVHVPEIPTALGQIVAQLLEKDPERRIPQANVLARQLEAMQRALSLGQGEEGEFVVRTEPETADRGADHSGDPAQGESGGLATTRVATDVPFEPPAVSPPPGELPADLPETQYTAAFVHADHEPKATQEPSREARHRTADQADATERAQEDSGDVGQDAGVAAHFTPVAPEDLDRIETREPRPALISLQTWALAAGLIAVGLTVWYFLQPPSADALYDRIAARTADGSIDSLRLAEQDIQEFLRRYSGDRRSDQLREHQKEIDLDRLERRFELRAKGLSGTEGLVPVERAYLEAVNYVRLDPERGMAKLQALIDLYDHGTDTSGPNGQCLELARRRLVLMREELDRQAAEQRMLLQDRLDEARQLAETEPDRARAIYRAVIELYQEKPWAAELVGEAQEGLAAP